MRGLFLSHLRVGPEVLDYGHPEECSVPSTSPSRDKGRKCLSREQVKDVWPVQQGLPDVSSPEFKAEARRESLLIAHSPYEADDQAFIDSISEF